MFKAFAGLTICVVAVCGAIGPQGGCFPGVTADTTVADALQQVADAAQQSSLLNQLTVGDVVQAFQNFVASQQGTPGTPAAGAGQPMMSADQMAQVEDAQAQLDSGNITAEQFSEQVQNITGDKAPNMAFGGADFFGSPFGMRMAGGRAAQLNLTDAQISQARDIFQRLHDDIQSLRTDAQSKALAVLTDAQRAQLDQLRTQILGGLQDRPRVFMGMMPPPGRRATTFLDRLANKLGLSDDQKTQIQSILSDLRDAVKARHEQARQEFRGILTADQLAILDSVENNNG